MHLRITKPQAGLVNIEVDDRRGMTGMRIRQKGVEVGLLETVVGLMVGEWKSRRDAIIKAKKPKLA